MVVGATQMRRDGIVDRFGLHGLSYATLHQIQQGSHVHRHQHISRRACAFGLNALQQTVFDEHGIDLDATLLGKRVQQRLNQARFARGVQSYLLCRHGWQRSQADAHGKNVYCTRPCAPLSKMERATIKLLLK